MKEEELDEIQKRYLRRIKSQKKSTTKFMEKQIKWRKNLTESKRIYADYDEEE